MLSRTHGETLRPVFALAALCVAAVLGAMPANGAAQTPATVTGTIASTAPGAIVLTTADGPKTVKITGTTNVISRTAATLSDIKPGDFIGVDAKKGADGTLTAVSINIFPPQFKGRAREGQWLMNSGDTMTNAIVTDYVAAVSGRTLALTYQGQTWKIAVPPSAAIHRLAVASDVALQPKMQATARGSANPDGSVTATSITVDQAMH
jgi:hypothetical protein